MSAPFAILLAVSLILPCQCTLNISIYSDGACSTPSSLVPSVSLPSSFIFPNSAYGTGNFGVSFAPSQWTSPPIIPSPAPVQCAAYYCGVGSRAQLVIYEYTYLSPQGSCPYNSSSFTNYQRSNQTLQVPILGLGGNPACQPIYYTFFNQSQLAATTATLYGTYTCTDTSSAVSNSASSAANELLVLVAVLALVLILVAA